MFFSLFFYLDLNLGPSDFFSLQGPFPILLTDLIFIELSSRHLFFKSDSTPSNEALDLLERRCHFPDYGCFSKKNVFIFLEIRKNEPSR